MCVGSGTKTESTKVSVVGVQTDISRVQLVRETTYASVASQAGSGRVTAGVDVEMGGVKVPGINPGMVNGVVWAQALLIHKVNCRREIGPLLAAAKMLRVGNCVVWGVWWLLGLGRCWGKRLSSLVVYLDRPAGVQGHSV